MLYVTLLTACTSSQLQVEQYRLAKQIEALQTRISQDEMRLKDIQEHLVLLDARAPNPKPSHTQTVFQASTSIRQLASRQFVRTKQDDEKKTKASSSELIAKALRIYQAGHLHQAYTQFQNLISTDQHHPQADTARFWMGTCKFELGEFTDAIAHFSRLQQEHPKSAKIPEALFKIGLAFEKLSDPDEAQRAFSKLVKRYPHSDSAELASKRLPNMPSKISGSIVKENQHAH